MLMSAVNFVKKQIRLEIFVTALRNKIKAFRLSSVGNWDIKGKSFFG